VTLSRNDTHGRRGTFISRQSERFARVTDRKGFLRGALGTAMAVTLLDRVQGAAAAVDSPNCCCCSPACWNVSDCSGGACGCDHACCVNHNGPACTRRYDAHGDNYSWTCSSGGTLYVCSDWWCGGKSCNNPCICSYPCSGNTCGTGVC
jgi:hypothetical protein